MINATEQERVEQAQKGFESFVSTLTTACRRLNRELKIEDCDADCVNFSLDGYDFTLSWGETTRPSIGRQLWVVQYTLCIWHTIPGGRWNPPENVDTTLVTSQNLNDCIRSAFETVTRDQVRAVLEDIGYAQMLEQEKQLEEV